jgi:transcriptional regulator with XRE-family HTH domain
LGITPSSYSRIETGQTALTIDTIFSIAAVLGLDTTSLISEAQRVIAKVSNAPNANVQFVPLARSNTVGTEGSPIGKFVTGAALGALLAAILSS